jgi:hypothetical protein
MASNILSYSIPGKLEVDFVVFTVCKGVIEVEGRSGGSKLHVRLLIEMRVMVRD